MSSPASSTNDPIADVVAKSLMSGQGAFKTLQQQHFDTAQANGARIVAAGLAVTRNQAMAPMTVDQAALAAALGVQVTTPAQATQVTTPAQATTNAAANATATQPTPAQATSRRSMTSWLGWGIAATVITFIVVMIVWNLIASHALNDSGWATHPLSLIGIPLALAVGVGLIVADWRKSRAQVIQTVPTQTLTISAADLQALTNAAHANASANTNGTPANPPTLTVVQSSGAPQQPAPAPSWDPFPRQPQPGANQPVA